MLFQDLVSTLRQAVFLGTLPLALAIFAPAAEAASLTQSDTHFDGLYVFGDSLSDTGNLFADTGDLFPPFPYFQGRFSNGPVWVEYLAPLLGLTPAQTTNFAYGGATTGSNNTVVRGFPGLQTEISDFLTAQPSADPDALYVVWAGANDYLGDGVTNPAQPVGHLLNAVTSLTTAGAENILVVNLPDLGTIPGSLGDPILSSSLSTLTIAHNLGLNLALNELGQSLGSEVNLTLFDVNSLLSTVITNPSGFGFSNVTNSCLSELVQCSVDPSQFLFWDALHPTTTGHQIIAESALAALHANRRKTTVPEASSSLAVLFLGAWGSVGLLRRRPKGREAAALAQGASHLDRA